MNDPMAAYLAAVYVGDFERHEQALRDDLLIRNYIPSSLSDTERQSTLDALAITQGAIEYFEGLPPATACGPSARAASDRESAGRGALAPGARLTPRPRTDPATTPGGRACDAIGRCRPTR